MSVYVTADEVAAEIETRLARITPANGFVTDIGTSIFHGKIAVNDEDVPCVSIVEGVDNVRPASESQRFARVHVDQQYTLIGYAPCDPANPNVKAREMIRDLKRAIFGDANGQADAKWGGKVRQGSYRGRNIGPRADGAAIVMAYIEIEVEYAEDLLA